MVQLPKPLLIVIAVVFVFIVFGSRFYQSVPAGHVAVATLFGEVQPKHFTEGLHIPVNPLFDWYFYDVRQKTHSETSNVPSQDQLQTKIDVSVQYRLVGDQTPSILKETGSINQVIAVHVVPQLRSQIREQGKTIKRAEDFFLEETQNTLQVALLSGLREYLGSKGVEVEAVLIRDITLPPFIIKAIEGKKEREQEVEKQKAELERYHTEQQQKIALAIAEKDAASAKAEERRLLADARAYEITKINEAIGKNPNYVKLQALEALQAISKDPAAKIYFINGDSPQPLPLMHLGDIK
ncbi:MAG TPA: prohibitin family protein [Candidatus Latescibacteria bacterium]|nr:prohibitin family protein [Candidatus Handelsmanbacteria bacterium]HIL10905.1 prohibitin family protein [Candidatus Latescibacterota bacterium]